MPIKIDVYARARVCVCAGRARETFRVYSYLPGKKDTTLMSLIYKGEGVLYGFSTPILMCN